MMKQIIDEFKTMPGVIGCCIYSSENGGLISNLPVVFRPERLTAIGEHLLKLHRAGNKNLKEVNDISIHFAEALIVTRCLKNNLLLFIFCDPSLNQNLLVMSLNLLQDKFTDSTAAMAPGTTTQPQSTANAAAPPPEVQSKERLSALVREIRPLLGKILGPMAGYVFDEVFSDWQKQGNADIDHIGALIDMLNHEIADTDKIEHFQKLIAPHLNNFHKG